MSSKTPEEEIDKILEKLIDLCGGNIWWSYQTHEKNPAISEAIQAIHAHYKAKLLSLIGEDEPEADIEWQVAHPNLHPEPRNQFRQTLRQEIEKWGM